MRLLTREALLSFRRAPLLSALSITTIAFSLFTIGLFGLVAINLREALRGLEERVEIVAFVLRGTPAETITLATQDIAAFPEVQDVDYVSEEQALARARTRAGGVPRRLSRPAGQSAARLARGAAQGGLSRRGAPSSGWRSGSAASASSTTSASGGTGCRSSIISGTSRASSAW